MRGLLAALGRQARWALPAGVFVGILVPDLAAAARWLLTPAVIGTLTAALLRLDWEGPVSYTHLTLPTKRIV